MQNSSEYKYLSGFGNILESEALKDALPKDQNNPQKTPNGLYAEQLSGSAFTAVGAENLFVWLYRRLPSVASLDYQTYSAPKNWLTPEIENEFVKTPTPLRWASRTAEKNLNFIDSMFTVAANGSVSQRQGSAIHLYNCDKSMDDVAFLNADAQMLIVPQSGSIDLFTEFGRLNLKPGEIAIIPRGVRFSVIIKDSVSGYICENFGSPFVLPYKGPIGANGLANARHFLCPTAWFDTSSQNYNLVTKFQGEFWQAKLNGSAFDVVAWYGNYVPFKYDLNLFNTINTVSFDHPDPSIFTVLTSPTQTPGVANVDFVIFPPRWMVAENTFRPPYFHRNIMSEYMGLLWGAYDAKPSAGGFVPGGGSLHNCMTPHGPEAEAYESAIRAELKPEKLLNTLAFMFESSWVYKPSKQAMNVSWRQTNYIDCWQGFKKVGL